MLLKKNNLIFLIFIVSIVSLYWVPDFVDPFKYKTLKKVEFDHIAYDSQSKDHELSRVKELTENIKAQDKEISINFEMKAYSISDWNNVFQTAPSNSGIRMELSKPDAVGLVIGTNNKEGYRGFHLGQILFNQWHKVEIKINRDKRLRAVFDDKTILDVDPAFDYDISDIAIGTGFNKLRGFQGEIRNFSIEYKLCQRVFIFDRIVLFANILLVLSVLLLFYKLVVLDEAEQSISLQSQDSIVAQTLEVQRKRVRIIYLFVIAGFILSTCQYLVMSYYGFYSNVFDYLFSPIGLGLFDDFTNPNMYVQDNNPYALRASFVSQFPFLFRLASLFSTLPKTLSIFIFLLIFIVFFMIFCWKNIPFSDNAIIVKYVLVLSSLTYPFLFCLNRGNYEIILFIFLATFIYLYKQGKVYQSIPFLSLAISLKPFPSIFIILLLSDRKYKPAFYTLLFAFLITVASYASFKGGILENFKLHIYTLQLYNNDYAIGNAGLGYCNSAFCGIKTVVAFFNSQNLNSFTQWFFKLYTLGALIFFAFISIYIYFVEKEFWKKVALLVFCMNILPHVSADYKLIHVFIPLFLFVNKTETDDRDLLYALIFSLMLISKSYYYFRFDPSLNIIPYVVNSAVILNPIIMIMGIIIIVFSGLSKWYNTRYAPT